MRVCYIDNFISKRCNVQCKLGSLIFVHYDWYSFFIFVNYNYYFVYRRCYNSERHHRPHTPSDHHPPHNPSDHHHHLCAQKDPNTFQIQPTDLLPTEFSNGRPRPTATQFIHFFFRSSPTFTVKHWDNRYFFLYIFMFPPNHGVATV